ncbi:MAG: membrane protein insertion efficiency factor YidD [Acidobacteria bacterium]|nr:membrane protein insertion efficiency factor YidD [Acidobacteriota bacterium]MXZ72280.1 membrane protein insertion efficiency factor YidD [Acidobacteriota bacterium]MYD71207.1 membrane protein insertion efficiency factor YidD [Acidobacteriota bacterium]MYJ03901.1 membrane protein insertion efficiency factor YidD [Acidobacteriota bacterium]
MPLSNGSPVTVPDRPDAARVPRPSPAARLLLVVIRGYQLLLSPMFAGCCRFVPSCSAYAAEAVARHGAVRGSWLSLTRLLRCHPLCQGGLDPVPDPAGPPLPPGTPNS